MKLALLLIVLAATFVTNAFGQDASMSRKKHFNLEKTVAIQGYDPVAYFKQNKAVKGNSQLAASYEGVTYYFSSTENKEAFAKSPASYEPQYGGWCAFAMGNSGEKVEIDPATFKVLNGKLYLFYNKFFNNTLKSWNKDETNLRTKADANWQKIYH